MSHAWVFRGSIEYLLFQPARTLHKTVRQEELGRVQKLARWKNIQG